MAFKTKTDPFGLAGDVLALDEVSENASQSVAEALNENGVYIASTTYGSTCAPSATYKVKKSGTLTGIVLGAVTTWETKRIVLTNLTISTSAGGETTVTASGEQVEASTDGTCAQTFSVPDIALGPCHNAKTLFSAFTLSGTGCHVSSANYTAACDAGKVAADGETVAHGVHSAYIEANVEIIQSGSTEPTLTAGSDWFITSPLSESNPSGGYATYAATLRRHVAATAA